MNYYPLTLEDNQRCAKLEDVVLRLGDAMAGIDMTQLKSSKARTAQRSALAMLTNARHYLNEMYEAEVLNAQRHAKQLKAKEIK